MIKSHCQPSKPPSPFMPRIIPEIGAPITEESGMAAMKAPMMRPR